jgi:pilus assembly protein CpaF
VLLHTDEDTDFVLTVRDVLSNRSSTAVVVVHSSRLGMVVASAGLFAGAMTGTAADLGPLAALASGPGVTDVLVNGSDSVWVDRGGGLERVDGCFADDRAVRQQAQRLAAVARQRLDDAVPFVDAGLPGGIRMHAALPPVVDRPTISLRMLIRHGRTLAELVDAGQLPADVGGLLRAVIQARLAFLVVGGTGAGKTTLLNALLGCVPAGERIVIIEDTPELAPAHPHVVRLRSRQANVEGAGEVDLRALVRNALRMRPDRLVVGEFRGAEMVDLLVALNTGHEGGAATLHANSVTDVPARIAALAVLAGVAPAAAWTLAAAAIAVVVEVRRDGGGRRRVTQVGVVELTGGEFSVAPAWCADRGRLGAAPGLARLLVGRGVAVPEMLR